MLRSILVCLPVLMLTLVVPLRAAEPAVTEEQRKELEKQVEKLKSDAEKLAKADDLTAARKARQQVLENQIKLYGDKHWKVTNARYDVSFVTLLEDLTPEQRKDFWRADELYHRAEKLDEEGKYQEALSLAKQALMLVQKTIGEKDPDAAAYHSMFGHVLVRLERYAEAQPVLEKALAIRQKFLGDEHPYTLTCLNNLAANLDDMKRYAEAAVLYRRVLDLRRRILGEENAETADSYTNLAICLKLQRKYSEADLHTQKALAIYRKTLGEEHPKTANAYTGLAQILERQGKYREAELLHRQALAIRQKVQGADHPNTAWDYESLAGNLQQQGKYAEAEVLCRNALRIWLKVNGDGHSATIRCYGKVGNLCFLQKKNLAEAEKLTRLALELAQRILPEDLATISNGCNDLGLVLKAEGKYQEAEPFYRRALAIDEKLHGEEHPHTATCADNLALCLKGQGKLIEAESLCRRALAIREKVQGKEHLFTAISYNNLGQLFDALGNYQDAERQYRKAYAIAQEARGEEDPYALLFLSNIAASLQFQGKYAESEVIVRRLLVVHRKLDGEETTKTGTIYKGLSLCLAGQNKFAGAEEAARRALAIVRKTLGEEHPITSACYSNLAVALSGQGKNEEAEALYRRVLAADIKSLGEDHIATARALTNLGAALVSLRKDDEAEGFYRRALSVCQRTVGENHPETASCYNRVGMRLMNRGNFIDADWHFRRALVINTKRLGLGHPDTAVYSNNVAVNLCHQGRYAEAVPLLRSAAEVFETARQQINVTGLGRSDFTAAYSRLSRLAAVQARLGKPDDAWQSLEQTLARGLLDELAARNNRSLSSADQKREAELFSRQAELTNRIELLLARTNLAGDEQHDAQRLANERDQIQAELVHFQANLQAKYGVAEGQVYDLLRIQAALPPEAALLAWLDEKGNAKAVDPNGDHWACLVLKRGTPVWIKLAGSGTGGQWTAADDDLAEQVRKALRGRGRVRGLDVIGDETTPSTSDEGYPGDKLAQQRLGAVERYLERHQPRVRHLIVLPSKTMAAIPIESLTSRYSISYAPSGTMFAYLQEQAAKGGKQSAAASLLALGDPAFAHVVARPATPPPPPPDHGILITQVVPGSNGAKAGIQADDVLLSYAGTSLSKTQDLPAAIQKQGTDVAKIAVKIWRDGRELEVTVGPGRLGVMMANDPAPEAIAFRRAGDELLRRTFRSDHFVPLPGTRREVEAISQLFADRGQVEALLGSDANEQRLDRLAQTKKLATFRYVHLATHAKPDLNGGLQSFLALAPATGASTGDEFALPYGRLTAEHILRDWKMDADLVTLSACETGLGKQSGGEGYVGFAQALFLAGGRSLVLSLWPVDDTATALLMTRFYQNLLGRRPGLTQPMPKAAALAEAKRWLRGLTSEDVARLDRELPGTRGSATAAPPTETHPYAHPNYWASFILVGDPGDVSQAEPVVQLAKAEPPQDLMVFGIVGGIMLLVFAQHLARPWLMPWLRPQRPAAA
jgi:CHAT domain-containing protein/Flp pilus assembly protein TadD